MGPPKPTFVTRRALVMGTAGAVMITPKRVIFATPAGALTIELAIRQAPLSCADFLRYVNAGQYNGGRFFRVVRPGNDHGHPHIDVVQGGIASPNLAGAPIAHESTRQTGLRHVDATVSLPRDKPGTATGAEIFVCIGAQPALDFGGMRNPDGQGFAAFGRVVSGMELIRQIWQMPAAGPGSDPYTAGQILTRPVPILSARA